MLVIIHEMITVRIFKQLNLVLHNALSVRNTRTKGRDSVRRRNRERINTTPQELVVRLKGHVGIYRTTLVVNPIINYRDMRIYIRVYEVLTSVAHVVQNRGVT